MEQAEFQEREESLKDTDPMQANATLAQHIVKQKLPKKAELRAQLTPYALSDPEIR
ncbi:MAG: hypothetical protein MZV70_77030 [Desulfobacterales bacterium]|nr:hypothetical protein [Desulfobacterales bacterium]